eukprot:COSAG03_NODE_154_length_11442_cov_10.872785_3_plen_189_part_00
MCTHRYLGLPRGVPCRRAPCTAVTTMLSTRIGRTLTTTPLRSRGVHLKVRRCTDVLPSRVHSCATAEYRCITAGDGRRRAAPDLIRVRCPGLARGCASDHAGQQACARPRRLQCSPGTRARATKVVTPPLLDLCMNLSAPHGAGQENRRNHRHDAPGGGLAHHQAPAGCRQPGRALQPPRSTQGRAQR